MRALGTISALFLSLALAFIISWKITSAFNFAYPVWYQVLEIDQAITKYGPQNIYKKGFESTSTEQHFVLFEQIADSIELPLEQVKPALMAIEYRNANQELIDTLLHESEVQHLYDVAVLLNKVNLLCYSAVVVSALILALVYLQNVKSASVMNIKLRDVYSVMATLLLVSFGVIAAAGFEPVFYKLHTWVFPANNQWHFYYQESLMTTLMQAPYLFAYIGGFILAVLLTAQWGIVFALQYFLNYRSKLTLMDALPESSSSHIGLSQN